MHKNNEVYLAALQEVYGTEETLSATDYLEVLDSSSLSISPTSDPVNTVAGTLQNQNAEVVGLYTGECQLDLPICGGKDPHWIRLAPAAGLSVTPTTVGESTKYTLAHTDVCEDATVWKASMNRRTKKSTIRKLKNVVFDWKIGSDIGKMATFGLTGKGAVVGLPTEGALFSVTKSGLYVPAVLPVSSKLFIGSAAYKLVKWEITGGNVTEQEIDDSEAYGYGVGEITDRKTNFSFTLYQTTPNVVDPHTALNNGTSGNITLEWGKVGEKITLTGSNAMIKNISESTQGNILSWDITGYFVDNAISIVVNSDLTEPEPDEP